ncbi:MAG: hypothetical protein KDJ54_03390 [Candidatus Competibacteraceae bacterium]|nr:hypothetical protein [Candidatus Competibacteraceae bacterium]
MAGSDRAAGSVQYRWCTGFGQRGGRDAPVLGGSMFPVPELRVVVAWQRKEKTASNVLENGAILLP